MGYLHRLIAFDLDGTIVDSRRDLADSANQLIEELGGQILTEEQIGGMVGEGAALLVRRALRASGRGERAHALERFLEIYDERLLNHTRVYDGVAEVVRQARGRARLTVLTNKPTAPTERILAGLGLRDAFDEVIGGDGPYRRKPDPAGLRAMMKAANTVPEDTLLVGDSAIDLETARRAEVCCCLVSYGFGFRRELVQQQGSGVLVASNATELRHTIEGWLERA
ncbi:MAG TPA: HAD-IA family hydrolase [Vicinamibacterales bacterium]|nr:HAD-IA family hydrolase [Vicinamibacterales bacterium]